MRENFERLIKAWERKVWMMKTAAHIPSREKANISCSDFTRQLHLMVSFKPWLTSHSSPSSFSLWKSGAADLTDTQHKGKWTTQWQKGKCRMVEWSEGCAKTTGICTCVCVHVRTHSPLFMDCSLFEYRYIIHQTLVIADVCVLLHCTADCNSGGVYCLCVACCVLNILYCAFVWQCVNKEGHKQQSEQRRDKGSDAQSNFSGNSGE